MLPPIARIPCTSCGYTSDPGSLFCALCGSALRKSPPGTRHTSAAPARPLRMVPAGDSAGHDDSSPPPEPPGLPLQRPAPQPAAELVSRSGRLSWQRLDSWFWAGMGAAALAVVLGLLFLALNPALLLLRTR